MAKSAVGQKRRVVWESSKPRRGTEDGREDFPGSEPVSPSLGYAFNDLRHIQSRLPFGEVELPIRESRELDARSARTLISRLHNIVRDQDSHSNIIERFDEVTKLLFLKLSTEAAIPHLFDRMQENDEAYAARIRSAYDSASHAKKSFIPEAFSRLKANTLTCTRFRRHRVRCFNGTGGWSWRDGSSHASSSLKRCA